MSTRFSATRQMNITAAVLLSSALATGSATASSESANLDSHAIGAISRYCQTCWRNARLPADRWQDCTQEVFSRLMERIAPTKWRAVLKDETTSERREFIRAIDAVKKRNQRARRFSTLETELPDRVENSMKELRDSVNSAADEVLNPRQKQIIELTMDGWNVSEIASELDTSEARVSDEKYKAIKKLKCYFDTN